jgi:5-methylcytosine-specific restriction endonuclease McrA
MSTILALDISGVPRAWVAQDDAISYHAKNLVAWSLGEVIARYNGGYCKNGIRSYLETPSIIAIRGESFDFKKNKKVILTNKTLFARDRNTCAYCGSRHSNHQKLSRDHIIPKCDGGVDEWSNVVTSCMPCNQEKGCMSLEKANMQLLYVPYAPNHYENLLLQNRHILADQMEYLLSGVPKNSRARMLAAA